MSCDICLTRRVSDETFFPSLKMAQASKEEEEKVGCIGRPRHRPLQLRRSMNGETSLLHSSLSFVL